MTVFIAVLEVVNLIVLVSLWLRATSLWRKLAWTPVVLLPGIGPFLYAGLFGGMPSRYRDAGVVHNSMSSKIKAQELR